MSKGPEQLKFEQAVGQKGEQRSNAQDLSNAQFKWNAMAEALETSASDLETRAYSAPTISEQTGQAMQDAFLKTAATMRKRSAKLKSGAEALGEAATTLQSAQTAKSQMRELNDPGPWTGGTPVTDKEITAKSNHDTAVSTYNTDKQHNETLAAQHNQAMDQQNEKSTAVMKQVYGYKDPETAPGTYGSGGAKQPGAINGSGGTAPSSAGTHGTTTTTGGTDTTGTHHHNGGGGTNHHGGNPTGTPQGSAGAPGTDAGTIGGGGWTPGTPTQTTPGSVGSSYGGVGATLGAGIAGGAGGLFGGVRGGSALPTNGSGSTGAGGRSIGSTTRSGSSSTLGRSAAARSAAAMSAEEEAAMGRNGAAGGRGSAGAAGAGRTGGRGAAGRNGSAGRSGGRGAGTGGQGRGRNKKGAAATLDHMIMEEDWLDDEGQSPAVID